VAAGGGSASGAGRAERSCLGEELLLACRCQAGHRAAVGRRTRWGNVLRRRPEVLVAQEALDAFWVTDESAQFHAAPARRTLVHGQPEGHAHELGPSDVATPSARRRRPLWLGERRLSGGARGRRRGGGTCGRVGRGSGDDQRALHLHDGAGARAVAAELILAPRRSNGRDGTGARGARGRSCQ
jgi:hypothetical protein